MQKFRRGRIMSLTAKLPERTLQFSMNSTQLAPPPQASGDPKISATVELASVRKCYGDFVAVENFSLSIRAGGIYGLLGPNGAGKTSTIRMIMGIIVPDSGQITVFGEPLSRAHMDGFGYLPEERGLYKKMKILDHLVFLGKLKGLSSMEATTRSKNWCERFELTGWLDRKVCSKKCSSLPRSCTTRNC